MFSNDRTKVSYALDPERQGINLVNLLTEIFKDNIPQETKSLTDIVEFIKKAAGSGKNYEDGQLQ